jgi:hypothetical protein
MRRLLLLTFALLVTASVRADAPAGAPAAKPTVPALVVGTPPPKSFVARGIFRFSAAGGVAFHVATEGGRQVCAVYDPADGTPLLLSDGQQTLVYDLANSRIVRVPTSRGNVRIDWDRGKEKPLSFGFAVGYKSNPEKLPEANAWFRIDRFVDAAPALKHLGKKDKSELFAAERNGGSVEALQVEPGDPSWFRFTSLTSGEPFYKLELDATRIDQPLPDGALAFPDPKRLPQGLHLTDLDALTLPGFLLSLRDGRAWMAKLALCAGPVVREPAEKLMPNTDWDALRKRDATFGAAYRKELAEQGVELPTYPPPPATKPAR